jgi:hypothetical protein
VSTRLPLRLTEPAVGRRGNFFGMFEDRFLITVRRVWGPLLFYHRDGVLRLKLDETKNGALSAFFE